MTTRWLVVLAVATTVLSACGENAKELAGTWSGADGSFLILGSDGRASGDDGCNSFDGTWRSKDKETVELSAESVTLVSCPGRDGWGARPEFDLIGDGLVLRGGQRAANTLRRERG